MGGVTTTVRAPAVAAATAHANAQARNFNVTALITSVQKVAPTPGACAWHLGTFVGSTQADRAALAWIVARAVMIHRGGGSMVTDLWLQAALSGKKVTGADREVVSAFVEGVFGLPPRGKSENHLVGHVAEWLWYLHAREITNPSRSITFLDVPKFNVTEPGADGFVVFSDTASGETSFRLWEIKQHVGNSSVSSTVGDAYTQLKAHATRYLAQLTSIHSGLPGPAGELCKQLVDFWIECNDRAGVGIGVASAATPPPAQCFSTMGKHFPGFGKPGQLEGLLLAVQDLEELARDVRGYLWTVL